MTKAAGDLRVANRETTEMVMKMVQEGMGYREMAEKLGVDKMTVNTFMNKPGVKALARAFNYADCMGKFAQSMDDMYENPSMMTSSRFQVMLAKVKAFKHVDDVKDLNTIGNSIASLQQALLFETQMNKMARPTVGIKSLSSTDIPDRIIDRERKDRNAKTKTIIKRLEDKTGVEIKYKPTPIARDGPKSGWDM